MLTNVTRDKLTHMKLFGMLKGFDEQLSLADVATMSFESRFGLIVDREESERKNKQYVQRIRLARAKEHALVEDIDFSVSRGLDKSVVLSLASCDWVRGQQNVIISGPTGVGKTYLACALLHCACRDGFSAQYLRVSRLQRDLEVARADGSYGKLMAKLARTDVLLFDDWGLSPMNPTEARELLEIMEDRHAVKSSIITSQLSADKWYELIADPTIADALLDRIVHRSHQIKLKGPSMRKTRSVLTAGKH